MLIAGYRYLKIAVILFITIYPLVGCHKINKEHTDEENELYRLIYCGEGYAETSVNTSIFRQSPIVSDSVNQYISFYDKNGKMIIGKRALDSSRWDLLATPYEGKIKDAHRSISLGVDGKGTLHVAYDLHRSPLNYIRVDSVLGISEKNLMTGINEDKMTYPEFYTLPDGDLLFAYRYGRSGNGNMVLNHYSCKEDKWTQLQTNLIDGEDKRNAYWQIDVDANGVIHLSWVWRETSDVATNHDLCYARSADGGKSWEKSNGEPYELPITMSSAEIAWPVPQNSELINQTSITSDSEGHVYIATYWRDEDKDVPQYRVVWNDGENWNINNVGDRVTPFSLSGGGTKMVPISRPKIISDGERLYYFFRDKERGSVVSMATADKQDLSKWEIKDLTDFSVDAWEPTMDMNLWNREKRLDLFVQRTHQGDGEKRSKNKEKTSPVYLLEIK